jgi:hypothetical protein
MYATWLRSTYSAKNLGKQVIFAICNMYGHADRTSGKIRCVQSKFYVRQIGEHELQPGKAPPAYQASMYTE